MSQQDCFCVVGLLIGVANTTFVFLYMWQAKSKVGAELDMYQTTKMASLWALDVTQMAFL